MSHKWDIEEARAASGLLESGARTQFRAFRHRPDGGWKASALPTPVLNELASIPYMETLKCFAEQVEDMKVVLARHDAAIAWHTMGTELFAAIDAILSAEGGDLQAAIERLRAIRTGMQLHEKRKMVP